MSDEKWAKSRGESYRVYVESLAGEVTQLDKVESGSLDWSAFRDVRSGGEITVMNPPSVDWLSAKVRVTYLHNVTGAVVEVPLGVYLVTAVSEKITETAFVATLTLQDLGVVLVEDVTDEAVSYPVGTVVTDAVKAEISAAYPGCMLAVTDSSSTLPVGMAWPAATARIKIINELLAAVNYFSVWVDELGVFRAQPYMPPGQRPTGWEFAPGECSVISSKIDMERDLHSVANKVVLVSTTSNDPNSGFVSVVKDEDPESPYSYPSRGRWVAKVKTGVQAANQAVLDSLAQREMSEARELVRKDTYQGLWVPLGIHDNAVAPDGTVLSLVERKITLKPGTLNTYLFRKVERV